MAQAAALVRQRQGSDLTSVASVIDPGAKEPGNGGSGQWTPAESRLGYAHLGADADAIFQELLPNTPEVNEYQILPLMKLLRVFALSSHQFQLHLYL